MNGTVIDEDITRPTFREMLEIDEELQKHLIALKFAHSGPIDEHNSVFQGFAIGVSCLEDVKFGYLRVKQIRKFADHVVVGYRIKVGDEVVQGCAHDKEYYGDQKVLRILCRRNAVNVAVYIAREYGGTQLGTQKFEIIRNLTSDAIDELDPEILPGPVESNKRFECPKLQRPPQPPRRDRQAQEFDSERRNRGGYGDGNNGSRGSYSSKVAQGGRGSFGGRGGYSGYNGYNGRGGRGGQNYSGGASSSRGGYQGGHGYRGQGGSSFGKLRFTRGRGGYRGSSSGRGGSNRTGDRSWKKQPPQEESWTDGEEHLD